MCVYLLVCLSVCLLFIGHTTFVHFAALPPSTPRAAKPSRAAPRRARGQACTFESTRARMPYNFSTKKSYADAFQKQNRTRARMLSYYSLPSLGVFTFRIVLNRTSSLVGADLGQLVYTYKRVVCVHLLVCLSVCLLFIGHTTFVHFAALPPSGPEQDQPSSRAAPRTRASMHLRDHARACRTTSQRRNRCADAFQKQNRTRAHTVVYVTAEIFKKKGKRKPTCHFPSSVYSLPSPGVFTFRIVLNRT